MLTVWSRYIGHVVTHVGGVYEDYKNPDQEGNVYTVVPKANQKEALVWLHQNAFQTPTWMVDKNILQNIDYKGYVDKVSKTQARHLINLLSADRLGRLFDANVMDNQSYSAVEFMSDLRKGIWKEASTGENSSPFRRSLQRAYLDRMDYLLNDDFKNFRDYAVSLSDLKALVRGELTQLKSRLSFAKNATSNTIMKYHYIDCISRIEKALEPNK